MRRNFDQVAKFLQDSFPELHGHIEGGLYPTPPVIELLSKLVSGFQLLALVWFVYGGDKLLRLIGYQQLPPWYNTIQTNAIQIGMALFLIVPQFVSALGNTNAFEIYLDDEEIWSRRSTGAFPSASQLLSSLSQAGLAKAQAGTTI